MEGVTGVSAYGPGNNISGVLIMPLVMSGSFAFGVDCISAMVGARVTCVKSATAGATSGFFSIPMASRIYLARSISAFALSIRS